ncbi:MAG: hypothetical protein U9Q78_03215 [Chloroflexota bacterium]|nr:hypothetical protein [Chloroflexota bacterium]
MAEEVGGIELKSKSRPKAACWILLFLAEMVMLGACHPGPHRVTRSEGAIYFPQTGHTVQGPFLVYFQAHGGSESFGYPITGEFLHHGLWVQYFEKARMEYHPENPPRYRVQLGLLGERLGRREPPIPPSYAPLALDRSRRYYPQTGHTLSQPFLAYYDARGDLDRFGYPLSEPYRLHGILVQDFQRARLILKNEEIQIADWGRAFLAQQPHPQVPPPLSTKQHYNTPCRQEGGVGNVAFTALTMYAFGGDARDEEEESGQAAQEDTDGQGFYGPWMAGHQTDEPRQLDIAGAHPALTDDGCQVQYTEVESSSQESSPESRIIRGNETCQQGHQCHRQDDLVQHQPVFQINDQD